MGIEKKNIYTYLHSKKRSNSMSHVNIHALLLFIKGLINDNLVVVCGMK